MKYFLWLLVLLALFCGYMQFRNNWVYHERNRVIDAVFSNDDYSESLEKYYRHSYNEMMLKFWKPVKSFYAEDFPEEIPTNMYEPFRTFPVVWEVEPVTDRIEISNSRNYGEIFIVPRLIGYAKFCEQKNGDLIADYEEFLPDDGLRFSLRCEMSGKVLWDLGYRQYYQGSPEVEAYRKEAEDYWNKFQQK